MAKNPEKNPGRKRSRLYFEDLFGYFPFLKGIGDLLSIFPPTLVSIASFASALLAGITLFLAPSFLILTSFFLLLNLFFDSVDGYIARKTRRVSKIGDFLDHVLDRFSDIVIFLCLTYSPYVDHEYLGLFALISILLLSYIGTQGKAIGMEREFISPANRVNRMYILILAPLVELLLQISNIKHAFLKFTFFDLLMGIFIILAVLSTIIRIKMIVKKAGENA